MTIKSFTLLREDATVIKNETTPSANTADRVGGHLVDVVDKMEELSSQVENGSPIDHTYAWFVAAIGAVGLTAGVRYRITDFHSVYKVDGITLGITGYVSPIEPLVVTALSGNTYDPKVKSDTYPDDIIFWDHSNSKWATNGASNGFGIIYYREDPINAISHSEDWRNVKYPFRKLKELDLVTPQGTFYVPTTLQTTDALVPLTLGTYDSKKRITLKEKSSGALDLPDILLTESMDVDKLWNYGITGGCLVSPALTYKSFPFGLMEDGLPYYSFIGILGGGLVDPSSDMIAYRNSIGVGSSNVHLGSAIQDVLSHVVLGLALNVEMLRANRVDMSRSIVKNTKIGEISDVVCAGISLELSASTMRMCTFMGGTYNIAVPGTINDGLALNSTGALYGLYHVITSKVVAVNNLSLVVPFDQEFLVKFPLEANPDNSIIPSYRNSNITEVDAYAAINDVMVWLNVKFHNGLAIAAGTTLLHFDIPFNANVAKLGFAYTMQTSGDGETGSDTARSGLLEAVPGSGYVTIKAVTGIPSSAQWVGFSMSWPR